MPTRKQRRRAQKERRHEYETVWVDEEGNELEEPPDDAVTPTRDRRSDKKPTAKPQRQPQRGGGGRAGRIPPPPSWRRSIKRSVIWIVVLGTVLVWVQSKQAHPNYVALVPAVALYVLLFPAMTYYIDRMVYRRYQAKNAGPRDAKKR